MVDSESTLFGIGKVIDVARFGDLEKIVCVCVCVCGGGEGVTAYVCWFVDNLKLLKERW